MRSYKGIFALVILIEVLLIVISNILSYRAINDKNSREYRVEIKRIADELSSTGNKTPQERIWGIDLSKYKTITGVFVFDSEKQSRDPYEVREVDGIIYCICYREQMSYATIVLMDISLILVLILTIAVGFYIYRNILFPFEKLSEMPYELAKGEIVTPIRERRSRYFGKYIWGMDMLRERLEEDRRRRMSFERDKKTLLLSLSHDIKTPLQTMELYDRALVNGLYKTDEQKSEAYRGIGKNISEIGSYINRITAYLRDDIVDVQLQVDEIYLSEVMASAINPYRERLEELHVRLDVETENRLVSADPGRLIEVLQNLMENAIKYGDGKYIRISQDEEEDCCLVRVTSSGCSVKSEEIPHLMESFYRGSNSTRVRGSGLGLYISRELMRRMDGDLYIETSDSEFSVVEVIRLAT